MKINKEDLQNALEETYGQSKAKNSLWINEPADILTDFFIKYVGQENMPLKPTGERIPVDCLVIKLEAFLDKLTYEDFHNGKMPRVRGELENGQLFVTDYYGNDLTLCRKVKPRGRAASNYYRNWKTEAEPIKKIIKDCNEKYGSPINGPFLLPEAL